MVNENARRRLILAASVLSSASAAGVRAAEFATTAQHEKSTHERRLQHKHRTLTAWRSLEEGASVRPLDLRLDESDPTKVYQVGVGGFLEPYDFGNYQEGFDVTHLETGTKEGPALSTASSSLGKGGGNDEGIVHVQSERLPLTNFDLNRWMALQGYADTERKLDSSSEAPATESPKTRRRLSLSGIFKYTEDNDPYDRDDSSQVVDGARNLKRADSFVDNEAPVVRSTFPPVNTKIGPNQSFGALVSDNGTGVRSVCLQLRDHVKSLSDCFDLVNVGFDVWELTFDGFDAYEGMTWSYRIRSKDGAKNRVNTRWADFVINISGKAENETDESNQGESENDHGGESGILTEEVRDESWPYGGLVQRSTGRILFFFDGNAYVCTGTVLDDEIEDRTVIVSSTSSSIPCRALSFMPLILC